MRDLAALIVKYRMTLLIGCVTQIRLNAHEPGSTMGK